MNKTSKIVIAIIVAGLLIGGGIWLATRKEEVVKIPLEDKTEVANNVLKDSYMTGCMEGNEVTYTFCDCTYNSLINQMGKEKVIEMSVDYSETSEIPASVIEKVAKDCL